MGAYFHSYQNTASSIITAYSYNEPFAFFLKKYFRHFKKYGSRDRKIISDLCFGYFRIGQAALHYSLVDQLIIGYYLTHQQDKGYLQLFNSALVETIGSSTEEKLKEIKAHFPDFDPQQIFPFHQDLSSGTDKPLFARQHLKKPSFFIRLRPGRKSKVIDLLQKNGIAFHLLSNTCARIENNFNIEDILELDSDCVVQDLGSQRTFDLLNGIDFPVHLSIWDACAGSGGKAIMAHDLFPQSRLYVSDIREEILEELVYRLKLAHIKPEKVFCTDLLHPLSSQVAVSNLPEGGVDLIIADVPCTGSGTWGRSPEWLRSFDETLIESYHHRQISIVSRVQDQLKAGGHLLYITCSVFRRENEEVVEFINQNTKLKLLKHELISGSSSESDHLFAALFILTS